MKILFLTGSLNQGGAEFQILALARLFKEKGNSVEVLALTDYSFYKPYIETHEIRYSHFLNSQSRLQRMFLTAKKFREVKPDLVIAYIRAVGQIAIYAKLFSMVPFKLLIGERTSLKIPGYDTYYFNLMRLSGGITVNSISKLTYIKENFSHLSKKTFFIPNIIDLELYKPAKEKKSDDQISISFIGRVSPEKNVLELIKAIKLIVPFYPKLVLDIYGDTRNPNYLNQIHAEIAANPPLEKHVLIHGQARNVLQVLNKSTLLCLISDFEGFSNVISEALCCGVPVIASDIPENRYLIEDGVNGFLVDHKNIEDIKNGILKFLNLQASMKEQIAKNNRLKAEDLFDRDKIYNTYTTIIKSLN